MGVYNYKVTVKLKGFEKEIKRVFIINDNVRIKDFCESIIQSMNGDLDHLYALYYKNEVYIMDIMDKNSYNDIKMGTKRIGKLLLDKNDKLLLNYDFGDNWVFNITINKVMEGHNEKDVVLIDGMGKGIEEDCGGVFGLSNLISHKKNERDYNIDDFDIGTINAFLDKYYNQRKKN